MRRVVLAHDEAGRSVFSSDTILIADDIPGVGALTRAWAADEPASYPDAGRDPEAQGLFPPIGGARVHLCTYPPGQRTMQEGPSEVPWEEDGIHATDTTDFSVVLDGEIVVGTDGEEKLLRRGDLTVMCGARHYWRNASDEPATVVFFMLGAERRSAV